jgi:hypothetical protein
MAAVITARIKIVLGLASLNLRGLFLDISINSPQGSLKPFFFSWRDV